MTSGSQPGTATSASGRPALASDVRCDNELVYVTLMDGREVSVQLTARLRAATVEERDGARVVEYGTALRWESIDEDLSVAGLLGVTEAELEALAGFASVAR